MFLEGLFSTARRNATEILPRAILQSKSIILKKSKRNNYADMTHFRANIHTCIFNTYLKGSEWIMMNHQSARKRDHLKPKCHHFIIMQVSNVPRIKQKAEPHVSGTAANQAYSSTQTLKEWGNLMLSVWCNSFYKANVKLQRHINEVALIERAHCSAVGNGGLKQGTTILIFVPQSFFQIAFLSEKGLLKGPETGRNITCLCQREVDTLKHVSNRANFFKSEHVW